MTEKDRTHIEGFMFVFLPLLAGLTLAIGAFVSVASNDTPNETPTSHAAVRATNLSRTIELPYGYKFQDVRVSDTNIVVISRVAEEGEETENYLLTVLPGNAGPDELFTINVSESGF